MYILIVLKHHVDYLINIYSFIFQASTKITNIDQKQRNENTRVPFCRMYSGAPAIDNSMAVSQITKGRVICDPVISLRTYSQKN